MNLHLNSEALASEESEAVLLARDGNSCENRIYLTKEDTSLGIQISMTTLTTFIVRSNTTRRNVMEFDAEGHEASLFTPLLNQTLRSACNNLRIRETTRDRARRLADSLTSHGYIACGKGRLNAIYRLKESAS
jgi:hypothetical protein